MQRLAFALAAVGLAAWASGQEFKLGSKVGDFALKDVSGAPVAFEKLKGRVTVIGFIATKCPISNDYNERMKALYADYQGRALRVHQSQQHGAGCGGSRARAAERLSVPGLQGRWQRGGGPFRGGVHPGSVRAGSGGA